MPFWPSSVATSADLHVAKNNVYTTLNGAIDDVTTTVVLTDASAFPSSGFVVVDTEIIRYTGITVNTLTGVTRGADGSTATSHVNGSFVFYFLVAAWHNDLKNELIAVENSLATTGDLLPTFNAAGYSGANLGQKIAAALVDVPSTGGIIDARALDGSQTITADPLLSTSKPVTVLLGSGTITITGVSGGNFFSLGNKCRLIGEGAGRTIIKVGAVGGTSNAVVLVGSGAEYCEIAHLTIDGGTDGTMMQSAISTGDTSHTNLYIHNVSCIGVYAQVATIQIYGGSHSWIDHCFVDSIATQTQHGIRISNAADLTPNYHRITNCVVKNGGFGISAAGSDFLYVANCDCYGTNPPTTDAFVAEGFNFDSCHDGAFYNLRAWGRGDGGFVETFNEYISGSSINARNHISGLVVYNNKLGGLALAGVDCIYQNILSYNNGRAAGNKPGVRVDAASSRVLLQNVYAFDNQGGGATQNYAVDVISGASQTVITGLRSYGHVSGNVNNGGTNTAYDIYDTSNNRFETLGTVSISPKLGIITTDPFSALSNSPSNYLVNTIGVGQQALLWRINEAGYTAAFSNDANTGGRNEAGVAINIADTTENASPDKNAILAVLSADTMRFMVTAAGRVILPDLTASRALVTGTSSELATSAVTSTELGYVSGVTSAIQTQLNAKATDSLVVHLAGSETITGAKTFSNVVAISSTTYPQLQIDDAASRTFAVGVTTSTLRLRDVTAAADRIIINSTGNVSIGSSSPSDKLDVGGNIILTGSSLDLYALSGNPLRIRNTTHIYIDYDSDDDGSGEFQLRKGTTTRATMTNAGLFRVAAASNSTASGVSIGASDNLLLWQDGTNGIVNASAGNLYLRPAGSGNNVFLDTGKVGIGTTPSAEVLELGGAIKIGNAAGTADGTIRWTGSDFEGRKAGAWTSLTTSASSGWSYSAPAITNVGAADTVTITSSANYPFSVSSSHASLGIAQFTSTDGTDCTLSIEKGTIGTTGIRIGTATASATLQLASSGSGVITLTSTGIGLSNTNPLNKVHIGTGTSEISLQIESDASTGASTATMTNSPVSGNPTTWVKISINGTGCYIPCWAI